MTVVQRTFDRIQTPPVSQSLVGAVRVIDVSAVVGGVALPSVQHWTKNEVAYSAGTTLEIVCKADPNNDLMIHSQEKIPMPVVLATQLHVNGKTGLGGE